MIFSKTIKLKKKIDLKISFKILMFKIKKMTEKTKKID